MRKTVGTVGGDVDLYEPVALQVVILSSRLTDRSILGQDDNTSMAGANANLVLGTDHTAGLNTTQFRLLDDKLLVAVVEDTAKVGYNHLLSGSYVGCTADNLARFALTQVNSRHMQVVAVGMSLARQYLTHIETFQTTLDTLHLFQGIDLETCRCQRIADLLRRQVEVNVVFQPFIRYVHDYMYYLIMYDVLF